MTLVDTRADEWAGGGDLVSKLELFEEVADEMRSAARAGIRRVLRRDPDEHDVEDVVVQAFNELCRKDLSTVVSRVGLARTIATRRGQDRGDRVLRERRRRSSALADRSAVGHDVTDMREDEFAATMEIVRRCKAHLTVDQREVIAATVEGTIDGTVSIAEFAALRGTTYEACRRICKRGIAALSKCVRDALVNGAVG